MTYTRTWDESQPPGSQAPSNIDDDFRALKVDIRERMNDILAAGHKWDTGTSAPIQVDPAGIAGGTGLHYWIGAADIYGSTHNPAAGTVSDSANHLLASVLLPIGSVIKELHIIIKPGSSGTGHMYLRKISRATTDGTWTTVTTVNLTEINDGQYHDLSATGLSLTVDDNFWGIYVDMFNNGDQVLGIMVVYDHANLGGL